MIESLLEKVNTTDRHFSILLSVVQNEPIGIHALSDKTENPIHNVRYSLKILEEDGLVEPTKKGAVTTDATAEFIENHEEVIDGFKNRLENIKEVRRLQV